MATAVQHKDLVRQKTRTTTDTFTDTEILSLTNTYREEIASKIQRARPSVWHIPAEFDLVANRREYAVPEDLLNSIASLELKLTNETADVYKTATYLKERPFDISLNEEDEIRAKYGSYPHYFIRRKAIFVLSKEIVAVTDGGILTYNAFPPALADLTGSDDMSIDPTTTSSGFPREFHELLARRVSIAYKDINELPLNREDQMYEVDLERALEEFGDPADDSAETIAHTPDRSHLGDSGFNY